MGFLRFCGVCKGVLRCGVFKGVLGSEDKKDCCSGEVVRRAGF